MGTSHSDQTPPELAVLHAKLSQDRDMAAADVAALCAHDRDLVLRFLRSAEWETIRWRRTAVAGLEDDRWDDVVAANDERDAWQATVGALRKALRVIVEAAGPGPGAGREAAPGRDEQDDDLPPQLVALMQLDADAEGSVPPQLAADLCGRNVDLALELIWICEAQAEEWRLSGAEADTGGDGEESAACEHEATAWQATAELLWEAVWLIHEASDF